MKRFWRVIATACLALLWAECAVARDRALCARMNEFVGARFDVGSTQDGLPDRWVEVHWLEGALRYRVSCRSSPDATAIAMCSALLHRASTEYPSELAFTTLECYGYDFPDEPLWTVWKASIDLYRRRWFALDVDFGGWRGEAGALRISVYSDEETPYANRAPLEPLRSVNQ